MSTYLSTLLHAWEDAEHCTSLQEFLLRRPQGAWGANEAWRQHGGSTIAQDQYVAICIGMHTTCAGTGMKPRKLRTRITRNLSCDNVEPGCGSSWPRTHRSPGGERNRLRHVVGPAGHLKTRSTVRGHRGVPPHRSGCRPRVPFRRVKIVCCTMLLRRDYRNGGCGRDGSSSGLRADLCWSLASDSG